MQDFSALAVGVIAALLTIIGLIARTNVMTRRIEECERLLNILERGRS